MKEIIIKSPRLTLVPLTTRYLHTVVIVITAEFHRVQAKFRHVFEGSLVPAVDNTKLHVLLLYVVFVDHFLNRRPVSSRYSRSISGQSVWMRS